MACGTDKSGDSAGEPDSGADTACSEPACNGVDDDCDGIVDEPSEPATPTWHPDVDGDGFGDSRTAVTECEAPPGHVSDGTDCNDSDPSQHPGAWDTPADGQDSDCDGEDAQCPSDGDARAMWDGDQVVRTTADAERLCDEHDGVDGLLTVEFTDFTDLTPLSCVCVVTGGLVVADNDALTGLVGLPAGRHIGRVVELTDNPALVSTAGLEDTTWTDAVSGDERLIVRDNTLLTDVAGFGGLRSLDLLQVRDLPALVELAGLPDLQVVTESLEVRDNIALSSVTGLGALVGADELRIEDNPVLIGLPGLTSLRSSRYLTVGGNALADLSDFAGVQAIDARLTIRNTSEMTDPSGLVGLQRLGGLDIYDNTGLLSLAGLSDASAAEGIGGRVEVVGNPLLEGLTGLEWVRWIDGDLHLGTASGPSRLRSLDGLEGLVQVTGDLSVARQRELLSLEGLGALEDVGALRIDGTGVPNTLPFTLDGLDRLTHVHGTLDVRDHPGLVDLSGLDAIETVHDLLVLDNPALTSLDGLDQLREADDIVVLRNNLLDDVSALYGLTGFDNVCVEAPGNPSEPGDLLAALGTSEVCP